MGSEHRAATAREPTRRPSAWRLCALLAAAALTACSGGGIGDLLNGPSPTAQTHVAGFIGAVVADEPRAALAAREILATGGNAADAAVALGFALAVTYPSRASLGAGGACLAMSPGQDSLNGGVPQAILFTPLAGSGGDRPAAVPMLARGLFALHASYGRQPFEPLLLPAERLAREGVPISRAFAVDLALVAGPLLADPQARAVFARPDGAPLAEGNRLVQPDLGETLATLRTAGVGDMYIGTLARRLADATAQAGGPITTAQLRAALPGVAAPLILPAGRDSVAFLPPPADGGLAAAAAFQALRQAPSDVAAAGARAAAVLMQWRSAGGTPAALLATPSLPPATLPALPASTTFATLDRDGNAVICAETMDNLFGTGRIAPGTGILLAASPKTLPPPMLAAAMAYRTGHTLFRAEVAASGQQAAALGTALGMLQTLAGAAPLPTPVPEPGRANAIACSDYLPDAQSSCRWAADPRGAGLALGAN